MTYTVDGLSVEIGGRRVVDDLSFSVAPGQRLGLIGESGSGKSLSLLASIGLAPDDATVTGSVTLDGGGTGANLLTLPEKQLAGLRGRTIASVFQDPLASLNPLRTVGRQIAEPLLLHRLASRREAWAQAIDMAREVGLPDPATIVDRYPHQLSGGQRQRVGIAMALVCAPAVILADEPTTALDVTTQAEILALMSRLVADRDAALVFVTHDLAVLSQVVDDVVVLSGGRTVERGTIDDVIHRPAHEVTQGLVSAARATTWTGDPS